MFRVIHNNLLNEKIGESNFETQEHLDQHKVLHPEMWEPNCSTVVTDITEEKDEEQSLNKRTKKRNLCIKAMDLIAVFHEKNASSTFVQGVITNPQYQVVIMGLLTGSPSVAKQAFDALDKSGYPNGLINKVMNALDAAIAQSNT